MIPPEKEKAIQSHDWNFEISQISVGVFRIYGQDKASRSTVVGSSCDTKINMWKPITLQALRENIEEEKTLLYDDLIDIFNEKYQEPFLIKIERAKGTIGRVYAIVKAEDWVVYYDDVECEWAVGELIQDSLVQTQHLCGPLRIALLTFLEKSGSSSAVPSTG